MAYCVNCGQQIPDGASFCTHCGATQTTHMQSPEQNTAPYSSPYGGSTSGTDYSYTGSYDAGQSSYNAGQGGYDAGQSSYNAGQSSYNAGQGGYDAGQSSYNAGQSSYNAGQGSYNAGQGGYDAGQGGYNAGQGSYNAGQGSYGAGQGGYNAGQGSYNAGQGGYGAGQSSNNAAGGYNMSQNNYDPTGGYNAGQGGYGSYGSVGGGPTPSMSFVEAVQTCVAQKYATFGGRARRSEYWYYTLFSLLVSLVASIVGGALFVHAEGDINILSALVSIALFLPGLGVAIRRLHDIGKSGWWYLIALVPFIGWIVLLIFMCRDSDRGPNQFGPSPKYPG